MTEGEWKWPTLSIMGVRVPELGLAGHGVTFKEKLLSEAKDGPWWFFGPEGD